MAALKKRFARVHRPRAAALVEMALVLPLLIMLVFGIIEYGWMFYRLAQINTAARHGARVAVRPAATATEVQTAVTQMLTSSGMTGIPHMTSILPAVSVAKGDPVKVSIRINYSDLTLTHFALLPLPGVLHGEASMAKEAP